MATKKKDILTTDFSLGKIVAKYYTGEGDTIEMFRTPSSVFNSLTAAERGEVSGQEFLYSALFYTLRANGEYGLFGLTDEDMKDLRATVDKLEDTWALKFVECYDNGETVVAADPTQAN